MFQWWQAAWDMCSTAALLEQVIQMPDHGRVRLALGHDMMFMSTYSIPLGGEKILIRGRSQIMKARPSWRIV